MTIDTRKLLTAGCIAMLAAVSGCQSSGGSSGGGSVAKAQSGLDGDWVSADGVAVSRFAGGVFTTNALDTGNKLADGSYRVNGNTIEITVISLIRNTTTNVNCAQPAANQLNCTSSTGTNFVLTRRAGAAA